MIEGWKLQLDGMYEGMGIAESAESKALDGMHASVSPNELLRFESKF